jgi:hypothetical protein
MLRCVLEEVLKYLASCEFTWALKFKQVLSAHIHADHNMKFDRPTQDNVYYILLKDMIESGFSKADAESQVEQLVNAMRKDECLMIISMFPP